MLPKDAALADLPTVSTAYPDKSSTAVSPIICSKALENSAIVSGVTVAIVSPTAAPATSGENVASAIDEYIDDNPEVVLPILVGGGVSTAGVILTIGAMAGAVMLPEAVIPVALGAGILASNDMLPRDAARADLPKVSTVYPDRSSTAVSPIICSKALENSAIVSGVTVAIVKYLIMTIMLAMSTVNAGENVASAIDEYIDDNPEVVLPILVGGGVSTAGVILTSISYIYLGGNSRVTSVASNDMLPRDAARADLPKVSTVYPDRSSTCYRRIY
jgi:hypothetical protein